MAVAFDSKTTLMGDTNNFSGATGINVGATATFLLAGVEVDTGTPGTPTATWNSVSMTQVGTTFTHGTTWSFALFGLVNPASGNKTFATSFGAGSQSAYIFLISFTGTATSSVAAATEGFAVNNATSTAISVTTAVSIPATDMAVAYAILDTTGSFSNPTTETMGGTQIGENTSLSNNGVAARFTGAGGTVNAHCTCTSAPWAAMIVGIAAPAAAGKVPKQTYFQQMLASKRKDTVGWRNGHDHRWRKWRRERGVIVPNKMLLRAA